MRVEDVPEELVVALHKAWCSHRTKFSEVIVRSAIAAVAPLIAAAERERIARWHDEQAEAERQLAELAKDARDAGDYRRHRNSMGDHKLSAAAIRARGEAGG